MFGSGDRERFLRGGESDVCLSRTTGMIRGVAGDGRCEKKI
jgi:hypothetical protein